MDATHSLRQFDEAEGRVWFLFEASQPDDD
jgi:hypothetical protein